MSLMLTLMHDPDKPSGCSDGGAIRFFQMNVRKVMLPGSST